MYKRKLEQYRKTNFMGRYSYEEIHVHDIYHSRGNFQALTKLEKYNLLNHLYQTIYDLPITIISVGINKPKVQYTYPEWNIFTAAWTFLTERFDSFISDTKLPVNGEIIVDTSSNMDEKEIKKIVEGHRQNVCQRQRFRLHIGMVIPIPGKYPLSHAI
jgi:hypothetical protein